MEKAEAKNGSKINECRNLKKKEKRNKNQVKKILTQKGIEKICK